MKNTRSLRHLALITLVLACLTSQGFTQTTAFTYQGSLNDNGTPANGQYDMRFRLFDAQTGGVQIGEFESTSLTVADGIFTAALNFGAPAFDGSVRWLEIAVKPAGEGEYTTLAPRRRVFSAPYAIKSLSANTATTAGNATQLGGVDSSEYVITTDPRMTDAREPTAGSGNYIQNSTTQQASSNFNISGTGKAGTIDAGQYLSNGVSFLKIQTSTLSLGTDAGLNNTGNASAFFGNRAGMLNTTGSSNSFFGFAAGDDNTTGDLNSFFGASAGSDNTVGERNSFFGVNAGVSNTTESNNSYFGALSGQSSNGDENSFFGVAAGSLNNGDNNSYFGYLAGSSGGNANNNSFFGSNSGDSNDSGDRNSFFGYFSGFANTTANGNSFFGSSSGVANTTGDENAFFGENSGAANSTGRQNSFFGREAGVANTTGNFNTFVGRQSGIGNTTGLHNTFVGRNAGAANIDGTNNSALGRAANFNAGSLSYSTVIGAEATGIQSNTIQLGRNNNDMVRIGMLSTTTGGTVVCLNTNKELAACSSISTVTNVLFAANGDSITSGIRNSFFGLGAGSSNTSGMDNTFAGNRAGFFTSNGSENSFFGQNAGDLNISGSNNSALGDNANFGSGNLNFATAIGSGASVGASNTIQLGRNNNDVVRIGKLSDTNGSTSVCLNGNKELAGCTSLSASSNSEVEALKRKIEKQATTIELLKKALCSIDPKQAICSSAVTNEVAKKEEKKDESN